MTETYDHNKGNIVPQPWVRPSFFARLARKLLSKNEAKMEREFRSWIRSKDPNERFNYSDPSNCCFAQFLKEAGYSALPSVGSVCWSGSPFWRRHWIPQALRMSLYHFNTFGGVALALEGRT